MVEPENITPHVIADDSDVISFDVELWASSLLGFEHDPRGDVWYDSITVSIIKSYNDTGSLSSVDKESIDSCLDEEAPVVDVPGDYSLLPEYSMLLENDARELECACQHSEPDPAPASFSPASVDS
jgi:hypothetical protein